MSGQAQGLRDGSWQYSLVVNSVVGYLPRQPAPQRFLNRNHLLPARRLKEAPSVVPARHQRVQILVADPAGSLLADVEGSCSSPAARGTPAGPTATTQWPTKSPGGRRRGSARSVRRTVRKPAGDRPGRRYLATRSTRPRSGRTASSPALMCGRMRSPPTAVRIRKTRSSGTAHAS